MLCGPEEPERMGAFPVPHLELDAAVLGTRVATMVQKSKSWNARRITYWSDAKDVLLWLRSSTRRYLAYVAHQVWHILTHSKVEQWRWIPSGQNPADWATKFADRSRDTRLW